MIGGQGIQVGLPHAGKTAEVTIEADIYRITVEDGIANRSQTGPVGSCCGQFWWSAPSRRRRADHGSVEIYRRSPDQLVSALTCQDVAQQYGVVVSVWRRRETKIRPGHVKLAAVSSMVLGGMR